MRKKLYAVILAGMMLAQAVVPVAADEAGIGDGEVAVSEIQDADFADESLESGMADAQIDVSVESMEEESADNIQDVLETEDLSVVDMDGLMESEDLSDEDTEALEESELFSDSAEADTAGAEEGSSVLASGTCGDSATWSLTSDGTLTISGTGAMYDYYVVNAIGWGSGSANATEHAPWYSYSDSISVIVVGEGITYIGQGAFALIGGTWGENGQIEKIELPDSLTGMGDGVFKYSGCKEALVLPDGLTEIGSGVFSGSTFTSVTWGKGITEIPAFAFEQTNQLTTVVLPEGVTSIGKSAFSGCSSLQTITLPTTLKSIGQYAFNGCESLTGVILPDTLETIDREAFYDSGLTSITVPASVTELGQSAFERCSALKTAVINANVSSTCYLFSQCSSLETVKLPDSLEIIGAATFNGCNSLKTIEIPKNVTLIGSGAFADCTSLTTITIPASVTNIYSGTGNTKASVYNAFYGCENLTTINVDSGNTTYKSQGGCLYNYGMTELIYCPEGVESVQIPATVGTIESGAFYSSSFGGYEDNYKLTSIYFYGNAPTLSDGTQMQISATAYYPADDATWDATYQASYTDCGASMTWVAWQPDISKCTVALSQTSYTCDGTEKKPTVTVTGGSLTLTEGTDYSVAYMNNVSAGTASVMITGMGRYEGTQEASYMILEASTTESTAEATTESTAEATTESTTGSAAESATESTTVPTADSASTSAPTQDITDSSAANAGSQTDGTTSGDTSLLSISVKSSFTKTYKKNKKFSLGAKSAGKLTYKSNKKSVVTVSSKGKVTIKGYGTAQITITATKDGKKVSKKVTVKIVTSAVKIVSAKQTGTNKAKVVWKRDKAASGYQIEYCANKKFKKTDTKTGTIKKNSPTSTIAVVIPNISKGTRYVRVRSYKIVSGKKVYGVWSKAKTLKIK